MPEEVRSTTANQLVILFEGSWFFIQDPEDSTRILALCPYVDAPDHVCWFGFWDGSYIAGPNATGPNGAMQEGESLWVDVITDQAKNTAPVDALFQAAQAAYSFPYLTSSDPATSPLQLTDTTGMRRVSISMPDSMRADGLLTNATVYGSQNPGSTIKLDAGSSYVDFLFVYDYDTQADVAMGTQFFEQPVFSTSLATVVPHLIFKVMGTAADAQDMASEYTHLVQTFDSLRQMVFSPDGICCDVAIYPEAGQRLQFEILDPSFSAAELGIPSQQLGGLRIRDYASCAAGPFAASGVLGG